MTILAMHTCCNNIQNKFHYFYDDIVCFTFDGQHASDAINTCLGWGNDIYLTKFLMALKNSVQPYYEKNHI